MSNLLYRIEFIQASSYDWFYTVVFYDENPIVSKACCKNYVRASRWASRRIRNHRKGLKAAKEATKE